MKYFLSFLLVSLLLLSACGPEQEEQGCAFIPETSEIEVEITLTSLSDSLANVSSKEALVKLLGDH